MHRTLYLRPGSTKITSPTESHDHPIRKTLHKRAGLLYLFFNLPFGNTAVVGGIGRVDVPEESGGGLLSFFGFFVILLLRCSPLAMVYSSIRIKRNSMVVVKIDTPHRL